MDLGIIGNPRLQKYNILEMEQRGAEQLAIMLTQELLQRRHEMMCETTTLEDRECRLKL